ncbi:MAG: hypothetical protein IJC04_10760 [Oscillospiraceae bacterium]|nr:hypothetical protein [Oscillospiraceae bacterium]
MKNDFSSLNIKGMFCYGLKLIVGLIDYFHYDYSKWQDYLNCLSDFTLIDFCLKTKGRFLSHCDDIWDLCPGDILVPICMPDNNGKKFYPCNDECNKANWLYTEYRFCLNFKNCEYVKNHYRYNRPDKNQYSIGKYKEYYDLFMSADIALLRVIYDTLSLTDETAGEAFDGDRIPIMNDMLGVYAKLNITPPDFSGIPKEGYGKDVPVSFDSIALIARK